MKRYRILKWEQIKNGFTHTLLLGNGASRAIWDSFHYPSLYEEANRAGRIDDRLAQLFSALDTQDFEYVLKLLSQAGRVNKVFGINERYTTMYYRNLKRALIDTVREVHPEHEQVKSKLLPIAEFMKGFSTVLSLNYDLLVYWAMLEGNDKYGKWFKDGFVDQRRFDNDYTPLRRPYEPAQGATLVFYPHGSLIVATETHGHEVKLSRSDERMLLSRILEIWGDKKHIPLFVSEGETTRKLEAIRRSNYLKTVYDCEVDRQHESLAVYGWSFRDEDEHILRGFIHGGVTRVAVSVHGSPSDKRLLCEIIECKIDKMYYTIEKETKRKRRRCSLVFFESESDGVWVNQSEEATP